MTVREIAQNVISVGVTKWDMRNFDALIPTPCGSSNNAVFIRGSEKTVLIDAADANDETEFITNLMKLDIYSLDYVVCLHAEQDHSGLLPLLLEVFPMVKIVTNDVCKNLLIEMHNLREPEDRFIIVGDGDILSLGDKTLKFYLTPWVHWPDTMFAELIEDKILFTSDFLGAHYAAETLFQNDSSPEYLNAVKQYYAAIMMPFQETVSAYLQKIDALSPTCICPSHGPILKMPAKVVDLYKEWVSGTSRNKVVIVYVSMHGSTKQMANFLADDLQQKGVPVHLYNAFDTDTGILLSAIAEASTLIIAAPTVLSGLHPAIVGSVYLIRALRPNIKYVGIIGSFGWKSKVVEELTDMVSSLNATFLPSVYIKGVPDEKDIAELHSLADSIVDIHQHV